MDPPPCSWPGLALSLTLPPDSPTSQVTIDVRSPAQGKLVNMRAAVGQTVIVGEDLYELELVDGGFVPEPASAPAAPGEHPPPPAPPAAPAAPKEVPSSGRRVHPSGNVSLIAFGRHQVREDRVQAPAVPKAEAAVVDSRAYVHMPRLPMAEEEMVSVDMGGADHFI